MTILDRFPSKPLAKTHYIVRYHRSNLAAEAAVHRRFPTPVSHPKPSLFIWQPLSISTVVLTRSCILVPTTEAIPTSPSSPEHPECRASPVHSVANRRCRPYPTPQADEPHPTASLRHLRCHPRPPEPPPHRSPSATPTHHLSVSPSHLFVQ